MFILFVVVWVSAVHHNSLVWDSLDSSRDGQLLLGLLAFVRPVNWNMASPEMCEMHFCWIIDFIYRNEGLFHRYSRHESHMFFCSYNSSWETDFVSKVIMWGLFQLYMKLSFFYLVCLYSPKHIMCLLLLLVTNIWIISFHFFLNLSKTKQKHDGTVCSCINVTL